MRGSNKPKPTEAELTILRVLWDRGPSTVRDVHEALRPQRGTGYTTVLKLLQIMLRKGLVQRDDSCKTHVYAARMAEEGTQRQLVRDLLSRAFRGSSEQLVMRALESGNVTAEELARIRRFLDDMEGGVS